MTYKSGIFKYYRSSWSVIVNHWRSLENTNTYLWTFPLTGPDVALGNPHILIAYDYENCDGDILTYEYLPAIGIESISIRLCDLLSLSTERLFRYIRIYLNPYALE